MREGKQSFLERLTGTHNIPANTNMGAENRMSTRQEEQWEAAPEEEYVEDTYEETAEDEDEEPAFLRRIPLKFRLGEEDLQEWMEQ